jgi:hypothetical protein
MKKTILTLPFLLLITVAWSQNIDSITRQPQIIELSISTPEPRLKEAFQISLDINAIRLNLFKSLEGKVEILSDNSTEKKKLTINANAINKGRNEIGPLEFSIDKTIYTTNKLVYEVIDPLPNTDEGLWFRKVRTSDSTFCIIIEQRIPVSTNQTKTSDGSIKITTKPNFSELTKFKGNYTIEGARSTNSQSSSNFSHIEINGERILYMYGFGVYNFKIIDKSVKIKITKDKFENIPDDYKFENIIIR